MTTTQRKHIGIMQALLFEFEQHKLPTLLKIKDKVDSGGQVNQGELEFLEKGLGDAGRTMSLMASYPELHEFCQQVAHFYQEITAGALGAEQVNHNTQIPT